MITPTSVITIDSDNKAQNQTTLDPLPPGFIQRFFETMCGFQGGKIISTMLKSLYELTPRQRQSSFDNNNKNQMVDKKKTLDPPPKDVEEVKILQEFIFSNMEGIDVKFPDHLDLISEGRLPNLENITIAIRPDKRITLEHNDESFPLMLLINLPKLHSLTLRLDPFFYHSPMSKDNHYNPFESLTGPIILPFLENVVINDYCEHLDVEKIIDTLFIQGSFFPRLKSITLPLQFFSLTDRLTIKRLLNLLPIIPTHLSTQQHSFGGFSLELFEELSLLPSSRFSNIVSISSWPLHNKASSLPRDRILSSTANFQSLIELSLFDAFIDQEDFDKTSEWLFKMQWMKNIQHLKLPSRFLSPSSALDITSSPHLINLTSLKFESSMNSIAKESINNILQSPNLSNLTHLTLPDPTSDHIKIITTAPHLGNITMLDFKQPMFPYLSSIASSKTLCNLKGGIDLRVDDSDCNSSSTRASFVSFFQSPNIKQLTRLSIIFSLSSPLSPHDKALEDLMSFVSSQYLINITNLTISGVEMKEVLRPLFSNPALSNLKRLSLSNCYLNDDDIKALASSLYIKHLTHLDLTNHLHFTDQSLSFLSQSSNFTNLSELKLSVNSHILFSNNSLIELFASPFINKLDFLYLPCHPTINFEAIKYLIDYPFIFNQDGPGFPSFYLECKLTPDDGITVRSLKEQLNIRKSSHLEISINLSCP